MMQRMRDLAQGNLARGLVVVIIVVISAFGFGKFDFFSGRDRPIAVVNGEDISQSQFQESVAQRHRALQSKATDDVALQRDVLNMLIKRSLILGEGRGMKLAASQAAITERISQTPDFSVDGKFSPDRLKQLLAQNGIPVATFRDRTSDDVLIDQLERAVSGSEIPVPADVTRVAGLLNQKRDVAWAEVDPAAFVSQIQLTDAALQKYFATNGEKFQQSEQVAIDYIRLQRATVAATITVSDADVQAAYAAAKVAAAKNQSEQRHAAHILLTITAQRTRAQAISQLQAAAKRVEGGANFADVARELSEDVSTKDHGGDLGFISKGTVGETAFDDALWALQPGQVSVPVVTRAGVHLISLAEVRRQEFPPFAAQAAQLREDMLARRVKDAMSAKRAELANDAYELDPTALAKRYKLAVQRSEFFSRTGAAAGIAANRELVRLAFTKDVLDGGFSSPVVDVDQDFVVFKVIEHRAARPQSFAEAKEAVRGALLKERSAALAKARTAAIRADFARTSDTGLAGKSLGVTWQTRAGVTRNSTDLPAAVRQAAFALPRIVGVEKPLSSSTGLPGGKLAVVVVTKVSDDGAAMNDSEREMLGASLRNLLGQRMFAAYLEKLEAKAKIDRRTVAATTTEPTPEE